MERVRLDKKTVKGFCVRTTNAAEMEADTSKIGDLWDDFFKKIAHQLEEDTAAYGVYYDFESDEHGEYSIMAGVESNDAPADADLVTAEIEEGDYVVFRVEGELPEIVVECWHKIWDYFSSDDAEYQRAFRTDFEYYKSDSEVEIYISVL